MAKIKQEINSKAGYRLKQLRDGAAYIGVVGMEGKDCKVSQKRLSEFTGISVTTISDIERGKAPLTYSVASLLIKAWPSVRIEWLMGKDDYMTQGDVPVLTYGKYHWQYDCVISLLNAHGFAVNYDGEHATIQGPGKRPEGRYAWITREEWQRIVSAINDYPEFLLSAYFKEQPEAVDLFEELAKEVTNG